MKFKNVIQCLALVLGLLLGTPSFASHTTSVIPVNRAMLKVYAMSAAVDANASVYGSALVHTPGSQTYVSAKSSEGAEGLTKALSKNSFIFSVNNPKRDEVQAWATMRDKKGRELFYGYKRLTFTQDQNGYWQVDGGASFEFQLVDPVPVEIEGVYSARVLVRDDAGRIVRSEYLEVRDGAVYIPSSYTEQTGELVINRQTSDGKWAVDVHNLADGKRRSTVEIVATPYGSIKNHFRFMDGWRTIHMGPVARDAVLSVKVLTAPSETTVVPVSVNAFDENTGELPVGVRVSPRGQIPKVWYFVPREQKSSEILIPFPDEEVDWDITLDFELPPESERLNRLPNQYYGGGGGGGVVATPTKG